MTSTPLDRRRLVVVALVAAVAIAGATLAVTAHEQTDTHTDELNGSFTVSNLTVSEDADALTANVTNPTDAPAIQAVEYRADGALVDRRHWALNPGETEQIEFEINDSVANDTVLSIQTMTDGAVTTTESDDSDGTSSVQFDDQVTSGVGVTVQNATSPEAPYYIAVWSVNDTTGEPDTILGAREISESSVSDVPVLFDEDLTEDQTLVAAVHPSDNGTPVTDEILASDTANVTVESAEEPTEPTEPTEPSVTFEDQSSDGSSVSVANVSNDETPYYTAVWTINETTGEPEALLGATESNETDASDVSVTFEEPITENQTLVAAVHPSDNGTPVTDEILASDTANVTVESAEEPTEPTEPTEPSVTFEDQSTEGSSVSVANVSNGETPYFTAVWTINESSGEPAVLLGAIELNETDASAVSVTFDQTITGDQTLVAAVHPSENGTPVTDEILASDTANVTVESGEEPSSLIVGAAAPLS
ncbi:hypothetical protein GJ629_07945 [Halapricum sp. CBA1109]|uniref:DUF7282 domain-containing protein n=1 Tax=Halapricum sp. CBA1109 TaxID=2668068 RepID=UPI0012FA701B|nr:hypothetical protein [Halapricum sp. CBA1109]MUV89833.1 hypothetical protein [Halapricum sp. CBA1109]